MTDQRALAIALGVAAAAAAWWYLRARRTDPGEIPLAEADDPASIWSTAMNSAADLVESLRSSVWSLPAAGAPYAAAIAAAEDANGLPRNLLARLLYQESRYRPDVISGATRSSAGAVGIAQIVPKWHPGVDPTDPFASIDYAARYLASLYRRYGNWREALAAYNWGMGNLDQQGIAAAPAETRGYFTGILSDLGLRS